MKLPIRAVTALVLILAAASFLLKRGEAKPAAPPRPIAKRGALLSQEKATIRVFREAQRSVVYITTLVRRRNRFTLNVMEIPAGAGSGFVWDDQGHIVTNFHVIRDADGAQVTFSDGTTLDAELVGIAPHKDLAVLRVDPEKIKLVPIPVGASSDLKVGQNTYAIGNPFGLDQTLTTGVISALGREIHSVTRRPISGVIQTDAAINRGNSGGPLLDSAGRLIGINTMIYSPSGASAGIGFAVPVDIVNRLVPQLVRFGKVIRPGLGVQIAEPQLAHQVRVKGVLIVSVQRGSAAAKAKLVPTRWSRYGRLVLGDVIVAIDGKKVESNDDLFKLLDEREVGERVTLSVERDGRTRKVPLTLQELK